MNAGRAHRPSRLLPLLLPALLGSGGVVFAQSPENRPQSGNSAAGRGSALGSILEKAARDATAPLRALAGAAANDPRGDDAEQRAEERARSRPSADAPAAAAADPSGGGGGTGPVATANRTGPPAEKLETFVLRANAILNDGRSVRGKVTFRAPEKLVVVHKTEDIEYRKTIRVRDIRSIEITQWKGEPLRRQPDGNWIYRFHPLESTVTLAGGLVLQENARLLPYFEKFTVRNQNGEVTLFTYWIDLLRADGTWFTGITGPSTGLRRSGHKDVVRRIEFGDAEEAEEN